MCWRIYDADAGTARMVSSGAVPLPRSSASSPCPRWWETWTSGSGCGRRGLAASAVTDAMTSLDRTSRPPSVTGSGISPHDSSVRGASPLDAASSVTRCRRPPCPRWQPGPVGSGAGRPSADSTGGGEVVKPYESGDQDREMGTRLPPRRASAQRRGRTDSRHYWRPGRALNERHGMPPVRPRDWRPRSPICRWRWSAAVEQRGH